jgi:hypothetical protein
MSRCKPALLSMFLIAVRAWIPAPHLNALVTASPGARAPELKNHAPYPNSAQGLKQQLKDMRELARSRKLDQLREKITNLEFPDARAWYLANFGTSGLETAVLYENNLRKSQERLESQFTEFAREDGYFAVKKQNAKKVYPSLITSPEVFLATWERISAYGGDPSETPFGYFLFVDGGFRWDSTNMWVSVD